MLLVVRTHTPARVIRNCYCTGANFTMVQRHQLCCHVLSTTCLREILILCEELAVLVTSVETTFESVRLHTADITGDQLHNHFENTIVIRQNAVLCCRLQAYLGCDSGNKPLERGMTATG